MLPKSSAVRRSVANDLELRWALTLYFRNFCLAFCEKILVFSQKTRRIHIVSYTREKLFRDHLVATRPREPLSSLTASAAGAV